MLVPIGEGSPQLMGVLAGLNGGFCRGGEGHRDALAPDLAELVMDLVPSAAEVVVVVPGRSYGGARGSHPTPDPTVASMVCRGGERGRWRWGALTPPTAVAVRSSG